jgi:hypothetical protein
MALACVSLSPASGATAAGRPLDTALVNPQPLDATTAGRLRAAGMTAVRIYAIWSHVALATPIDASDPGDAAYRWDALDSQVVEAAKRGLRPILSVFGAPTWAYEPLANGQKTPDPAKLGAFASAVAKRYSGRSAGLPRVRYWQVWNEPNISPFLSPQFLNGQPFAPGHYRRMVNAFAEAVKAVSGDNIVIAGGTAPFRDLTGDVQKVNPEWGPLTFMREFLCLDKSLRPKCSDRARFDVWAHHPYTSGGPTHHANLPDDVSLGDMPEMKRVLDAAVRARSIQSSGPVRFWVTEFSWDSNPPDPNGVPAALEARWTAEALHRMWLSGVSLVTWFQLVDEPVASSFYQSGLYYRGESGAEDRPKPALQAFRFPFVAFRGGKNVNVWGRTPTSKAALLTIERPYRGGWQSVGRVRADSVGIFKLRLKNLKANLLRARLLSGEASLQFSALPVPDAYYPTFGLAGAFTFR